jgi:hypothetical protein
MRYKEISHTMRRFLGAWEGFRKLGFSSTDIFCSVERSARFGGRLSCFCVLKVQGRQFVFECGPVASEQEAGDEYLRVTKAVLAHELPQEDMDRIWNASEACQRFDELAEAILSKGIEIPNADDKLNELARDRRDQIDKESKDSN